MPSPMTSEEYLAELTLLTGMTTNEWNDFLVCTPDEQAVIAEGYRDMDWRKNADTFGKVLAILTIVGNIAGSIAGIAGAASAIAALKSL